MTHLPSTTAAMICLAVFLCLGMTEKSWGCSDCVCAQDNTCSGEECTENLTANCTRLEFTAACSGTYHLHAEVTSCGELCGKCYSCVNLYKITGGTEVQVANCHTNGCGVNNCETTCSTVTLASGGMYVLYVCKLYCREQVEECESCDEACVAVGCVYTDITSATCLP
jgi:hypothetical protein